MNQVVTPETNPWIDEFIASNTITERHVGHMLTDRAIACPRLEKGFAFFKWRRATDREEHLELLAENERSVEALLVETGPEQAIVRQQAIAQLAGIVCSRQVITAASDVDYGNMLLQPEGYHERLTSDEMLELAHGHLLEQGLSRATSANTSPLLNEQRYRPDRVAYLGGSIVEELVR